MFMINVDRHQSPAQKGLFRVRTRQKHLVTIFIENEAKKQASIFSYDDLKRTATPPEHSGTYHATLYVKQIRSVNEQLKACVFTLKPGSQLRF